MLHDKSFDQLLTFTLYLKSCGNFSTVDVVKATAVNFLTNIRGKAFEDPFPSIKFPGGPDLFVSCTGEMQDRNNK